MVDTLKGRLKEKVIQVYQANDFVGIDVTENTKLLEINTIRNAFI